MNISAQITTTKSIPSLIVAAKVSPTLFAKVSVSLTVSSESININIGDNIYEYCYKPGNYAHVFAEYGYKTMIMMLMMIKMLLLLLLLLLMYTSE